jgi:antitoxin MazE
MVTKVQTWGNSLAVRIPKAVAIEAGLSRNMTVELHLVEGKIVLERSGPPEETLEDLLGRVTPENRHAEVKTGPARGKEVW